MAMTILLAALAAQALPAPGAAVAWESLPDDAAGHNFLDPAMIHGPIAAFMLAAQPSPAPPPFPVPVAPDARWSLVGSQSGVTVFLDENSLGATGDRRRARIRMVGVMQPAGARSAVGTVEINCRDRTGRPIEIRFFDAWGELLETRSMPDEGAAVPTRPDSVDEQVQERVCGRGSAGPVT